MVAHQTAMTPRLFSTRRTVKYFSAPQRAPHPSSVSELPEPQVHVDPKRNRKMRGAGDPVERCPFTVAHYHTLTVSAARELNAGSTSCICSSILTGMERLEGKIAGRTGTAIVVDEIFVVAKVVAIVVALIRGHC